MALFILHNKQRSIAGKVPREINSPGTTLRKQFSCETESQPRRMELKLDLDVLRGGGIGNPPTKETPSW
jgi:hypothetical protein